MANKMKPMEGQPGQQPYGGKGVVSQPQPVKTSNRCRATHDVPYTLRCVLDALHVYVGGVDAPTMHMDKNGDCWET